jgi:hypothetical protein
MRMEARRPIIKTEEVQPAGRNLIGYYAAWSVNSGFTPDQIDAARLTHVLYAFASIGPDLRIKLGFPDIDPYNFSLLNALKQISPNLKTLISAGVDWSELRHFAPIQRSVDSRSVPGLGRFSDEQADDGNPFYGYLYSSVTIITTASTSRTSSKYHLLRRVFILLYQLRGFEFFHPESKVRGCSTDPYFYQL